MTRLSALLVALLLAATPLHAMPVNVPFPGGEIKPETKPDGTPTGNQIFQSLDIVLKPPQSIPNGMTLDLTTRFRDFFLTLTDLPLNGPESIHVTIKGKEVTRVNIILEGIDRTGGRKRLGTGFAPGDGTTATVSQPVDFLFDILGESASMDLQGYRLVVFNGAAPNMTISSVSIGVDAERITGTDLPSEIPLPAPALLLASGLAGAFALRAGRAARG